MSGGRKEGRNRSGSKYNHKNEKSAGSHFSHTGRHSRRLDCARCPRRRVTQHEWSYAYRGSWRCTSCVGCGRLLGTLSKEGMDSPALDHVAGDHSTALCPSHVSRLRVRRDHRFPDFCELIYAWIGGVVFRRFLRKASGHSIQWDVRIGFGAALFSKLAHYYICHRLAGVSGFQAWPCREAGC